MDIDVADLKARTERLEQLLYQMMSGNHQQRRDELERDVWTQDMSLTVTERVNQLLGDGG